MPHPPNGGGVPPTHLVGLEHDGEHGERSDKHGVNGVDDGEQQLNVQHGGVGDQGT